MRRGLRYASLSVVGTLLAALAFAAACTSYGKPPLVRQDVRLAQPPPTANVRTLSAVIDVAPLEETDLSPDATPTQPSLTVTPFEGGTPTPTPSPVPTSTPTFEPTADPEPLLTKISPQTPPNTVAALRLVEEGRLQMKAGRYDLALERFERAVAIDSTCGYAYYFLADLHRRTESYDQAIGFTGRAIALTASGDPVWLAREYCLQGAIFEQVGRFADARRSYEKALKVDPDNHSAAAGVARLTPPGFMP
jgi:hypothetical protein